MNGLVDIQQLWIVEVGIIVGIYLGTASVKYFIDKKSKWIPDKYIDSVRYFVRQTDFRCLFASADDKKMVSRGFFELDKVSV